MNKGKNTSPPESEIPSGTAAPDLKAIREAKGISIRDIHLATRISMMNLEAIEGCRFHLLPEPIYARTFIKTYAKFLDIENQPLLDLYEHYQRSLNHSPSAKDEPVREKVTGPKDHQTSRAIAWAGILIVVVVALLYLILSIDSNVPPLSIHPEPTPPVKTAPVAPPPAMIPGSTAGELGEAQPQPQAATASSGLHKPVEKRYRLVIKGIEKTWLRIREDQKRPQDMILNQGDVIERSASESFVVLIGNAGGIEIFFQGQSLGPIGERGQVVHLQLP